MLSPPNSSTSDRRARVRLRWRVYATGAIAALALALTFALDKGWLTIALALMVPGIAWIAERTGRFRCCAGSPPPSSSLVVARIGWEPRIVGSNVGTTPIFNWLLYGYGVPALSFWNAGHLLRKRADDQPARMVDARRSCSPCCSPSWKSVTSPTTATSIAQAAA